MSSQQTQLDMLLVAKAFEKFREIIGLDKRSLALFRIMLGLTTLFDIGDRMRDLQAHYTDDGVFPRSLMYSAYWNNQWVSVYTMGGTVWCQFIVFMVHTLIALLFTFGYWSRTNTILNWFFVVSLQSRNIFVGHGGDVLHRVVLFFAIFLPLGDAYSVDAALSRRNSFHKKGRKPNYLTWSVATVAITFQILIMYISAHTLKTGREWREIGTATWLALQLDFFRRTYGDYMLMFPTLCKWSTFAVWHWQFWGCLFFFSPIFTGPCKTFGVLGFFAMHTAFSIAFRLGQFGWVTMGAILILFPAFWWDSLLFNRRFGLRKYKQFTNFTLYYNPGCGFCTKLAKILGTFLLLEDTTVRPDDGQGCQCNVANGNNDDKHSHRNDGEEFVVDVKTSRNLHERAISSSSSTPSSSSYNSSSSGFCPRHSASTHHDLTATTWLTCVDHNGKFHENFDAFIALCAASPALFYIAPLLRHVRPAANSIMGVVHDHDNDPSVLPIAYNNSKYDYNTDDNSTNSSNTALEASNEIPKLITHRSAFGYESDADNNNFGGQGNLGGAAARRNVSYAKRRKPFAWKVAKLTWKISSTIVVNMVVAVLLWTIVTWNASSIGLGRYTGFFHNSVLDMIWATHLDQNWSMFAPRPPDVHWWYNIEATLDDGTKAELFSNGALYNQEYNEMTTKKPDPFYWAFKNHRWFKYYENGFNMASNNQDLRLNFGRWLCREYNKKYTGAKRLHSFSIHWVSEQVDTVKMDGTRHPRPKQTLWNHICYNK